MRHKLLELVDSQFIREDLPKLQVGQEVNVHVRIKEGQKERIQIFKGLIIAMKNGQATKNFTVRKMSYGVGVERTFPINSPIIAKIEVINQKRIRRAKLYYLRELSGKSARLKNIQIKKDK